MFTVSHANRERRLYFSPNLRGRWQEHPQSPIVENTPNLARPGGRVVIMDNLPTVFIQDDYPIYGNQVYAYKILTLTPTQYEERKASVNPVLKWSGFGGMEIECIISPLVG